MAVTTRINVPYVVHAITLETTEISGVERTFDTERCVLPMISLRSNTKFTVEKDIDTEFDTRFQIRGNTKRVVFVFN